MEQFIIRQLIFALIVCTYVAIGARKMGYSGFAWFIVSLLSSPLIAIPLLATLPNRAVEAARIQERARLEREMANARAHAGGPGTAPPTQTISNDSTVT